MTIPSLKFFASTRETKCKLIPEEHDVKLSKKTLQAPLSEWRKQVLAHSFNWKDFQELTKFKLSLLNTTVATTSFLMANKLLWSPECFCFMLATQSLAMCTQSINQIIEVEYDKQMSRTNNRPLPKNRISLRTAKLISGSLLATSSAIYLTQFPISTFVVAMSIFGGYLGLYTPLKRKSPINTTVGAVVGALPGYLGWLAAGGSILALAPYFLSLYIFCWQFPHFYGILWTYKSDYKKAGFNMIEDAIKASKHIKMASVGKFTSISCMTLCASISPYLLAQLPLMYWFDYKPMKEFERNPSIENAKKMKNSSYVTFTAFILSLMINECWNNRKNPQNLDMKNIAEKDKTKAKI